MRISDMESMLMTEGLLVRPTGMDCVVSSVTYNSKEAAENSLFICKGATFRREYLLEAVDRGAACYLSDRDYDVLIPGVIVTDIRKAMALCALYVLRPPVKKTGFNRDYGNKRQDDSVLYDKGGIAAGGPGLRTAQFHRERHGPPL